MGNKKIALVFLTIILLAALGACISTQKENVVLRLATTTSMSDTELLDKVKIEFEKANPGINLTWVAVGTGQAIEIGKRGDADAVLVHNRAMEQQFIKDGYGVHGVTIAYNDFIVVCPQNDPANLSSAKTVVEAFKKIASANATFVSRADKSGTNLMELDIWKNAGVNVTAKQEWYKEAGQGMAATLRMANNLQAYTLCDRATYLSLKQELNLKIVLEGDPQLLNLYRIILINKEKFPNAHYAEAEKLVIFFVSPKGQELMGNYTKGGNKLFNPIFGELGTLGVIDPYEDTEVAYWSNKLRG